MLVLTRKSGEGIVIGDDVRVVVVDIGDGQVKIGIEAPRSRVVHREEIYLKIKEENRRASLVDAERLAWAVGLIFRK